MDDDTGLSILEGITSGLEKAATNLYNINIAKQELAQKKEQFGLDKKIKELEIKKLESDPNSDPEEIIRTREIQKKQDTINSNLLDIQLSAIDAANKENTEQFKKHKQRYQDISEMLGFNLEKNDQGIIVPKVSSSGRKITPEEEVKRKVMNGEVLSVGEERIWKLINRGSGTDLSMLLNEEPKNNNELSQEVKSMLGQYKKRYPGRSDQELLKAMKNKGLY